MPRKRNPWLTAGAEAWALSFEAQTVIGLRMMKLAVGGAAAKTEAERMVSEKMEAAAALQIMALTGGLGASAPAAATKAIRHVRRKVQANRRRLAR